MVDHQKLEVKITLRVHNRWLLCDLSHSFEFDIGEVSVRGFVQLTTLFSYLEILIKKQRLVFRLVSGDPGTTAQLMVM